MQQAIETKYCRRCERTHPATPEYFARDRKRRDGLNSYCKKCEADRRRATPVAKKINTPNYDIRRLWQDRHCDQCKAMTSHIYCQSRVRENRTVYACFKCGMEVMP